jgi:hypothetical protein
MKKGVLSRVRTLFYLTLLSFEVSFSLNIVTCK